MLTQYGYTSAEKNRAVCRKDLDMIPNGNFVSNGYEECQNMSFFKILGVTRFWEYEEDFNLSVLAGDILNSCVRHGVSFAYAIIGNKDGINIYVGTMKLLLDSLKSSYEAAYPGIDIEYIQGIHCEIVPESVVEPLPESLLIRGELKRKVFRLRISAGE